MQEHDDEVCEVDFVPVFEEIAVEYDHNTTVDVALHDGSHLRLRKLHEDYVPSSKAQALNLLMEGHEKDEILTGVFYIDTQKHDFTTLLNLVDEPLATLPAERVRPGRETLSALMQSYS
jgi:2-oxoglutarate ferredoxin oxidoreductase subunit beta